MQFFFPFLSPKSMFFSKFSKKFHFFDNCLTNFYVELNYCIEMTKLMTFDVKNLLYFHRKIKIFIFFMWDIEKFIKTLQKHS